MTIELTAVYREAPEVGYVALAAARSDATLPALRAVPLRAAAVSPETRGQRPP
jgi:hypothetical protein